MLSRTDALLFAAVTAAAQQHMDDFNLQVLANTVWAFETMGRMDALVLVSIWATAAGKGVTHMLTSEPTTNT